MKYVEHIIMANDGTYLKFKNPNFVRLEEAQGCFAERPMEAHPFRSKGTAKGYADKINNCEFPLWGYKKSDLKDKFPLVAVKVELNVALPNEQNPSNKNIRRREAVDQLKRLANKFKNSQKETCVIKNDEKIYKALLMALEAFEHMKCEFVQESIERLTIEKTKLVEEYEEKINKINEEHIKNFNLVVIMIGVQAVVFPMEQLVNVVVNAGKQEDMLNKL